MEVKLVSITPNVEQIISYCARVSNPNNQDNPEYEKLLSYCIKNKHWSIFEMGNLNIEIITSRAISAQILRHKSFSFQEFSLRYSEATEFETYLPRRQDVKNRQNSIDDLEEGPKYWFKETQKKTQELAIKNYNQALNMGIAKECARMLLPLSTQTRLYMNGNVRSWITYIELRTDPSTQLEHREIAEECKKIFKEQLPIVSKALGW